jgi:hypothetical protein
MGEGTETHEETEMDGQKERKTEKWGHGRPKMIIITFVNIIVVNIGEI